MIIRQITFDNGNTSYTASISDIDEIQKAFELLELTHSKPVIVLVGGAGGIDPQHQASVQKAINIAAKLAQEAGAVIIDGGTQVGVMLEIGAQRKQNEYSFPLIGVMPGGKLLNKEPQAILDSNHTHFFLVPGDQWGVESAWIAKIATILSGHENSITILINGGEVSKYDVECGLLENRPTFAVRGTGRMADKINTTINLFEVDISQNPEEILTILREKLS